MTVLRYRRQNTQKRKNTAQIFTRWSRTVGKQPARARGHGGGFGDDMPARDTPWAADLGVHPAAVEEERETEEDSHARMAAENTNSTRKFVSAKVVWRRERIACVRFEFKRVAGNSNKGGLSR